MSWGGRVGARLYALLVTCLTILPSLVTLFDLSVDPLLDHSSRTHPQIPPGVNRIHAIGFSGCVVLSLVSYFAVYRAHPGSAEEWAAERPDLVELGGWNETSRQVDEEAASEMPICKVCEKPKPERVHHCRTCSKCVLRMDHHCPWIGNCVGFKNHKLFLLYLLYTTLTSVYGTYLLARFMVHCQQATRRLSGQVILLAGVFTPFAIVLAVVTIIGVGSLLVWNVFLLLKNQTNVEYHKFNPEDDSFGAPVRNYSRGLMANIRHIMGDNVWLWFIPLRQPRRRRQGRSSGSKMRKTAIKNHHKTSLDSVGRP